MTVVGATARLMDGRSAEDVLTMLGTHRSTFLAGVPTTYHHLIRAARESGLTLPDLRIGLVGGAVTGTEVRRGFEETFGVPLVDAYGSTETCGAITMNPPDGARVDGSCGLPVPGVGVRIVDPATGQDVPAGQEGEVWVSGPNIMVGYHNSPEATGAAIRDGWFRTGDLARRDDAGYLTICGRIKDLVIRGGENIHPEEIESVLRTVAGVADAGVSAAPHDALGEVPVAYLVPGPAGLDTAAVLDRCRERLAPYKLPEEIREVTSIPRTASGKIIRRRLADQPSWLRYAASGSHDGLLGIDWVPVPAGTRSVGRRWTVVGSGAEDLVAGLWAAGIEVEYHADVPTGRDAVEQMRAWAARADRCVVLTRGAMVATEADGPPDLAQVPAWGVVRSVEENAPAPLTVIDRDDDVRAETLIAAVASDEPELALRSGTLLVPRLVRVPVEDRPGPRPWAGNAGTVIVTGADTPRGAALVHRLLTAHRATTLLLVDTAPADTALPTAGWDLAGAHIIRTTVTGADPTALRVALEGLPRPVTAVIHAADDADLGLALHEITAGAELATFLVVADVAGVVGSPGRADVAVASVVAEALVRHRRWHGLRATFLAWPSTPTDGSPANDAGRLRDGLRAFDLALADHSLALFAMRPDATGAGSPAILRALVETSPERSTPDATVTAALRERLVNLDEPAQLETLEELVRIHVAAVLHRPGTGIFPLTAPSATWASPRWPSCTCVAG